MSHWAFSTDGGLETRRLAEALDGQPRGPAAVGPRAHLGLAVRLPRAGPLHRLPRARGWTGSATTSPCCSSRRCGATRRAVSDLYATLGVDPAFRPPAAGDPGQREPAAPPELDDGPARRGCASTSTTATRALADLLGRPLPWARRARHTTEGGPAVTDAARDRVQQGQRRGRRARAHRAGARAAATRRPSGPFSTAGQRAAARGRPAPRTCCSTTSCTAALEMSALLLDLQPGDTVIVPSFTFVSSALAFVREGAGMLVLRHRARDPRARPAARRRAARRHGARGRGRALRRHRLRHGRDPRGPRGPSRRGDHRGQRARPLRPLARPAARQPRPLRDAELPRDQELRLRRGRRPRAQRPRRTSTGPGCSTTRARTARRSSRARSTSTPGATPARRSGCPTRSRPTSSASSSSATSSRASAAASTSGTPSGWRRTPSALGLRAAGRPGGLRAGVPPLLRAAARPRDPHPGDEAAAGGGHADDLPLRARCTTRPAASSSRRARPSARSPPTSAAA